MGEQASDRTGRVLTRGERQVEQFRRVYSGFTAADVVTVIVVFGYLVFYMMTKEAERGIAVAPAKSAVSLAVMLFVLFVVGAAFQSHLTLLYKAPSAALGRNLSLLHRRIVGALLIGCPLSSAAGLIGTINPIALVTWWFLCANVVAVSVTVIMRTRQEAVDRSSRSGSNAE
ncbi:MAG TPA: hypothetical protein VGQ76_09750 [Thermoanaerobaculia bacterium]|nr:hypothetical protein [Thermoanaerobaculia bacterium]